MKRSTIEALSEEEISEMVLAERHELFPRLNPDRSTEHEEPVVDVLPSITHVRRLLLANMDIRDVPLEISVDFDEHDDELKRPLNEEADKTFEASFDNNTLPYQGSDGAKAVRSIEGRVATHEEDDGEVEEDEEEKPLYENELDDLDELQNTIETQEETQIRKAKRDQRWTIRDTALEIEIGNRNVIIDEDMRTRALNFALPELAQFNTDKIRKNMMSSSNFMPNKTKSASSGRGNRNNNQGSSQFKK